jgi:hemerythrin-like domain-containing protein
MTTTAPIEVRDMAIIHQTFRRAYKEAAALVRATPTPSPERVTFLADHIDFGLTMLHHHHEGEDEILYPLLEARSPEHAARTEEIDHEHELVRVKIDASQVACAAWRASPTLDTAEALANSLDTLNATLVAHLDEEEREVVPLAAVTVTQKEWDSLGKHGVASIPASKRMIAFGMILEPLNDADRAYMLTVLPPPVRLLYRLSGKKAWTKYASTLRDGK